MNEALNFLMRMVRTARADILGADFCVQIKNGETAEKEVALAALRGIYEGSGGPLKTESSTRTCGRATSI